ncbi:MAG: winged helix DNA-binding domain-containing protein, partial [Propionibacteriaceae bacterium]|nr:winged helix DNA-binding domain-containing protein [Propionibacteriaceae bacterium]
PPPPPDALAGPAAAALGDAPAGHLADYFRLNRAETEAALADLAAAGAVTPVAVAGWRQPAWLAAAAAVPAADRGACLVSPFDSLAFDRRRLADLFGVDYRLEIYTPAAKRVWGYYVYLCLLDGVFAARADLKADRARGALLVQAAWREPGCALPDHRVAAGLAGELRRLAAWLALGTVEVRGAGDLAAALAEATAG